MPSATNAAEPIPIGSAFFTGDELAASTNGFDALERRRESRGDAGVDAEGSADRDVQGVRDAETNDWLLSSFIQTWHTITTTVCHHPGATGLPGYAEAKSMFHGVASVVTATNHKNNAPVRCL